MTDHPYSTRSETKKVMTTNNDNGLVDCDLGLAEEVRVLKQHMKNMYHAWITGQMLPPPPPGFSDILPTVVVSSQAMLTKSKNSSNSEPVSELSDSQYNDLTVQASGSYRHTSHLESSTEIVEAKNAENEEMTRKMKESLLHMKKQCDESYKEFANRWREQAARVRPQMKECEIVETFLRIQEGDYYPHLLPALGKEFDEVIKIGEMIEDGIKTGRIMSFADIKAIVEVTQGDDAATLAPKPRQGMRGPPHPYIQPQSQTCLQAPYNSPKHYFPPQDFKCPIPPPLYLPHGPQSYVQSYPYSQWRTPIPRSPYPLTQVYRPRVNSNFRPRSEYKREKQHRKETSRRLSDLSVLVPKIDLNNELVKGTQNLFAVDNAFEISGESFANIDVQPSG